MNKKRRALNPSLSAQIVNADLWRIVDAINSSFVQGQFVSELYAWWSAQNLQQPVGDCLDSIVLLVNSYFLTVSHKKPPFLMYINTLSGVRLKIDPVIYM